MKNKTSLILALVLLIGLFNVASASAIYCYQESANVTNQTGIDGGSICLLDYSGTYSYYPNNPSKGIGYLYVNYTIPALAVNNSIWQVKHGNTTTSAYNITLPNSCLEYSSNLQLRLVSLHNSTTTPPETYSYPQCYNGTWNFIGNNITGTTFNAWTGSTTSQDPLIFFNDGNWTTGTYKTATVSDITSYWYTNGTSPTNLTSIIFEEAMFWQINNSITINIYDEDTLALITSNVTLTILNVGGDSYSSTSGSFELQNLTTDLYYLEVEASGYRTKTVEFDFPDYLQTYGSLSVYLTNDSSSTTFTILDFDTAQPLEGATINQYRIISGVNTLVDQKTSDVTGRAEIGYIPYTLYNFTISKSGYNTTNFLLNPVLFSSYDIKIRKSTALTESNTPQNLGVLITYYTGSVGNLAFYNNTNTTFYFNINGNNLNFYNMSLTYPGETISNSGTTNTGQTFSNNISITGASSTSQAVLNYCYRTTTSRIYCAKYTFEVISTYESNAWIANKDNTYGLGLFDRIMIVTIVVLVVTGIMFAFGGIAAGLPIGLFIYGVFAYMEFIPLWAILPSLFIGLIFLFGIARRG